MYEININNVSTCYEQKYSKKKIGYRISLSDTTVYSKLLYLETEPSMHRVVAFQSRVIFCGVVYEFHEATEHSLTISFGIMRFSRLFLALSWTVQLLNVNQPCAYTPVY